MTMIDKDQVIRLIDREMHTYQDRTITVCTEKERHALGGAIAALASLRSEIDRRSPAAAPATAPATDRKHIAVFNALAVMVLDTRIRAFLQEHDPMALQQALRALVPFLDAMREDEQRAVQLVEAP